MGSLKGGYVSRSDGCLVESKERTVDGLFDALEKAQTQSIIDAFTGKVDLNLQDCNIFGVRRGVRLCQRRGSSRSDQDVQVNLARELWGLGLGLGTDTDTDMIMGEKSGF
jgi:hypothetical protein